MLLMSREELAGVKTYSLPLQQLSLSIESLEIVDKTLPGQSWWAAWPASSQAETWWWPRASSAMMRCCKKVHSRHIMRTENVHHTELFLHLFHYSALTMAPKVANLSKITLQVGFDSNVPRSPTTIRPFLALEKATASQGLTPARPRLRNLMPQRTAENRTKSDSFPGSKQY